MNKAKRIIFVIIGSATNGIAISLYLLTGFGPDPYTVLADGLSRTVGVSVGIGNFGLSFFIILIGFLFGRKYLGLATMINLIVVSPVLNIFLGLFERMVTSDSDLLVRLIFFLLAYFLLSFGTSLYLSTDLGISVVDLTPVMVSEKAHIQFRWCKIAFDFILVASGFLLGGAIGLGTVFAALATGPLIQWLRKRLKPPMERFFLKQA